MLRAAANTSPLLGHGTLHQPLRLVVAQAAGLRSTCSTLHRQHAATSALVAARPSLCRSQQQQRRSRRQVQVSAAAAAPAAAAAAAAASFPGLQAALAPLLPYVMAAAAGCCTALILLMVVAPSAPVTQRSVRSAAPLVLLSLAYGVVLLASWAPDTLALMMPGSLEEGLKGGFNPQFFPTLQSVQALFGRPFTAASFLLHVAVINLIAARSAYIDGLTARVPTAHSILLSAFVGPLGLLSHTLTKGLFALSELLTGRDLRPAARPLEERSGPGTITILPYDKA